jgi:ribosomal protein S18 acetylase RimI-like enzyme
MDLTLRPAGPDDTAFLADMLSEAMAWRPGSPRPLASTVLASRYVVGWPREGDGGVVAETGGPRRGDEAGVPAKAVGASWYRLMTAEDPGYGFVDPHTPEITIGVVPSWRGRGVGRRLLTALLAVARADGHVALSLSVEEDNYALGLYESVGFRSVEKIGNAWTMLIPLR